MSATYTETTILVKIICGECGVLHAIPLTLHKELQENRKIFYCPNGHRRWFSKSRGMLAEEKLVNERARHDQTLADLRHTKQTLRHRTRSLNTHKGHTTRLKNRIKNGVCPCCNRSFENLHRHMKSKHPNYSSSEPREVKP